MGRLLVFAMALNLLNLFMAVNTQCQFSQKLDLGKQYYIYNERYPMHYSRGTRCTWSARSDPGTQVAISCEDIDLPTSIDCQYDKLSISLTGNTNFADAHNYCGKGSISLVSSANAMEIGLFSSMWGPPGETGRFLCTLTAIRKEVPTTTTRKPATCDCGWKQGMRITGGHETGVNEYPFMAALIDAQIKALYCGASIISKQYALTAAHCLQNMQVSNVGLLVGDHNITTGADTPYAQVYLLQRFTIHPRFNPQTQENDIAIVRTANEITFSLYVGPVCLPFKYTTNDFDGLQVTALGWGSAEFSGPRSDVLQEVTLNVISNEKCSITEKNITYSQLCTYAQDKDSCQSDSGGPLIWMASRIRRLELVGIISFGLGCATLRPSVNIRVTSYLSWIIEQTSDTTYCVR